jgi:hypothetical protein
MFYVPSGSNRNRRIIIIIIIIIIGAEPIKMFSVL